MNTRGVSWVRCSGISASRGIVRLPFVAFGVFLLGACAFSDPYPASWGPISPLPSEDCRQFEASYGVRGERAGESAPSYLTFLFFLPQAESARATRVSFSLLGNDILEVTLWEDANRLLSRTLTTQAGEFACEKGLLVVRRARWVMEGQAAGREDITIEFAVAGDQLVAKVKESVVGLAVVIPVAATQTRWYRFPRLRE